MGTVNVMWVLCDNSLSTQVDRLIDDIRRTNPRLSIKTVNNIKECKGGDFTKKTENIFEWANVVVLTTSENLVALIEKKDLSKCPDAVKGEKNFQKVLKGFLEKQMKKIPNKLSLISVAGTHPLPKFMKGMPVVENNGGDFATQVICGIEGIYSKQS